ncbi:MAG: SpaA isopeptide-forming pilin-related protein [Oscillospiraceae bacterium]|nr:SpaA isopeptide-forming pilin-related protein [Oscillospiraceae bacterium]
MKKISKKTLIIILLMIFILSVFQNYSHAETEISSADVKGGADCGMHIQYMYNGAWTYVTGHYQYYTYNGTNYPAYCLNVDLAGAYETGGYTVNVNDVVSNIQIWRVVTAGYPYKTPAQMGVANYLDAYMATKHAVYCILYGRDPSTFYKGGDTRGVNIVNAIISLVNEGRNGTRTPQTPSITFNKVGNITLEGDYYTQTYSVSCSVNMQNYTITATNNMPSGGFVADINGGAKTTFNAGENFKVYIPKSQFIDNIDVTIKAIARCETYPVFYGESPNSAWQDFALAFDPFSMNGGQTTLDINVFQSTLNINKKSQDTSENLQGVVYEVRYADNSLIGNFTTDKNGNITINNLRPGSIKIIEKSTLQEYITDLTEHNTVLEFKGNNVVNLTNALKRGNLEVLKSSEDNMIEGVKFHLYGTSLSGIQVDEYATTDSTGIANFKDILTSGSQGYMLEEVNTPSKYVIPTTLNLTVKWNEVTKATVSNVLKKFRVTLTKTDKEKSTSQGDAKLSGAVYGIYEGNTLIDTYTTDNNGQFTTKYYVCGDDWSIAEITPSEGYLLDKTSYHVGAETAKYTAEYNTTTNAVAEQVIKGNVSIIKHSDDGTTKIETPEVGATFQIYLKSAGSYDNAKATEKDTLVCDENGFSESKMLPYGIYTVHQTVGMEGRELIKDFNVYILQDGKTYSFLINNANFMSYIKIVKKDVETGNAIAVEGTGFQIYDKNKNLITMQYTYPQVTKVDTFYTNTDGYLITPQTLEYGEYYLKEVQAPYGYTLNKDFIPFTVNQDNSSEDNNVTVIEVAAKNMAQKGTITVDKSGEVFSSVTDNDNLYKPIYTVSGLADATYQIIADEDITTLDGTVRVNKGTVVDTITTGEDSKATSKPLYLGKYKVKEITAPYGMVLSDEIHNVELTYAGQNVDITATSTSFYNERQKVEIDLTKILETDKNYGVGLNNEILDVTFGLYADEDIVAKDGKFIPKDGLIEVIRVDKNGKGNFTTDLPFGKYYVSELSTNKAYGIDRTKYPVEFSYAGQDTKVVKVTVNDNKNITNKLIRGSIKGIKLSEDDIPLENAIIGIFKPNTTEFSAKTAIYTTVSQKDGSFSFENVPYGDWVIKELKQPNEKYVLSDEQIPVMISEQGQTVKVELKNYYVRGNIILTKYDKDYPDIHLEGAEFAVYDECNNFIENMEELQNGVYRLDNIKYGKYFVREIKAPEGFLLDENTYEVNITKNGKTYSIENEAGKGFANQAMLGNIKIKKTSSDGKLDGFTFIIEGTDLTGRYIKQSYVTNENGEINIERLRVGEYKIYEVSDETNSRYILPEPQIITVEYGKTVEVSFYNNELEIPNTGTNDNKETMIKILIIVVLGSITWGVIELKKKYKNKKDKKNK